ncbi:PREDICTED: serine protease SP24D-like [Bactrocera latifrons]|nr:PREDICTED: serine protease SP24D-like [Bactrocera latifrons]
MNCRIFYGKLLVVLALLVAKTVQSDDVAAAKRTTLELVPTPRILSGSDALPGQFPYVVSVRVGGQHICGGTIISQKSVLTAAHCVYSLLPHFLTVQAGSVNRTGGGVVVNVTQVLSHPNFLDYNNDIAILKLETALPYSNLIQPIPVATIEVPDDVGVNIAGWGRSGEHNVQPEILKYSRALRTISNEECARDIATVSPSILCLAKNSGNGICGGDAGGPAVYKGVLVGIASYHLSVCGANTPDGYTKMSYYKDWIAENSCSGVKM